MKKNLLLTLFALFTVANVSAQWPRTVDAPGGEHEYLFKKENTLKAEQIVAGCSIVVKPVNVGEQTSWMTLEKFNNNGARYVKSTFDTTYPFDNCIFIVEAADGGTGFVLKRKSDNKYLKFATVGGTQNKNEATVLTAVCPKGNFNNDSSFAPSWSSDYEYMVRFVQANTSNFLNINNGYMYAGGNGSWSAYYVMTAPTGGGTGIENVKASGNSQVLYNLCGVRVTHPTKGVYINGAGKKVLINK